MPLAQETILSHKHRFHDLDAEHPEIRTINETSNISVDELKEECATAHDTESEADDCFIELEIEESSCDSKGEYLNFATKYLNLDFEQTKEEEEVSEDIPNINVDQIKIERDSDAEEDHYGSKDRIYAIPEVQRISIEPVKIETISELEKDDSILKSITLSTVNHASFEKIEKEEYDYSSTIPKYEDVKIKLEGEPCVAMSSESEGENAYVEIEIEDSDYGDMSSEEENSNVVPNSKEKDESSSSSLQVLGTNPTIKSENIKLEPLDIKEEPVSDIEDIKHKNIFVDPEELLTGYDSTYFNEDIDKKEIVSQLIQEFHRRPQLWHEQLSSTYNSSQKNNMLQNITDVLNAKFNLELKVGRIKVILYLINKQYLEEKQRLLNAKEKTPAIKTNLWFYDKMRFLKNQTDKTFLLQLILSCDMDKTSSAENIKVEPLEIKKEQDRKHEDENMNPEEISAYIDNKKIVYELIQKYHRRPQIKEKEATKHEDENMSSEEMSAYVDNKEIVYELIQKYHRKPQIKEEEATMHEDENMSLQEMSAYIGNKEIVSELIQEYHRRPQLWHEQLSSKFNTSQKNNIFQSITDALNAKLNLKLEVDRIKVLLYFICKQYFEEKERQSSVREETSANNSNLWYYEKMRFLKNQTQNGLEFELVVYKNMIQLDENILSDLIDIYKTSEDLWKFRNIGIVKKNCMQLMCEEIKDKLKISVNTFNLENIIFDIHAKYSRDKRNRFTCEMHQTKFKPFFSHFHKCNFLEDYQGPFRCPQCKRIIETYHEFQVHTSHHDGKVPFKCDICGKVFNNEKTLNYHSYSHNAKNYNCTLCARKFRHPVVLKIHMQKTHQDKLKCKICKKMCNNIKSFNLHMSLHADKDFNCNICGKGFHHQRKLKLHKSRVHEKNELQCETCGQFFKNRFYLRYHSFRHNGKNYSCKLCKRIFFHPNSLNNHMYNHDEKNYECHYCGKRYPLKASLNGHKKHCIFRDL